MPPIEMGLTRPIGAIDVRVARQSAGFRDKAEVSGAPSSTVALSDALKAGEAPVDTDRVQMIKKAVESGQYPVNPAKIADEMIAAGLLLRKGL